MYQYKLPNLLILWWSQIDYIYVDYQPQIKSNGNMYPVVMMESFDKVISDHNLVQIDLSCYILA
jgi:hypothetical protein